MPAEEGLGFDVDQGVLPHKEPREQNHRQASGVGRPPGLDLAFQIESQLFAKKSVFWFEGRTRTRPEQQESENVPGEIKKD
jgi:hypothetical protein